MNWIGIRTLKMLGLAWDVKVAKLRREARRRPRRIQADEPPGLGQPGQAGAPPAL